MLDHEIGFGDLDVRPSGETVILKRLKNPDDYWDEGEVVDYHDTPKTVRFRSELAEINDWIEAADIAFDDRPFSDPSKQVDLCARRLRRVFTRGRFDSGGRMFGGFWQDIGKQDRLACLRIVGEPVIELDYGQAGARILYGIAGHQPPSDDLYHLWGYVEQRDGIKRVMSAMMFSDRNLERLPQGTRPLFRARDKVGEMVEAIEGKHPLIKNYFHRGIGHEVQFVESQIIVRAVLDLKSKEIVALQIHDALLVPASGAEMARSIMLTVFRDLAGVEGMVSTEVGHAP